MRIQWTTKGNQDAGSSCSCDQGLHRHLQNFGSGLNPPNPPSSVGHCYMSHPVIMAVKFLRLWWAVYVVWIVQIRNVQNILGKNQLTVCED